VLPIRKGRTSHGADIWAAVDAQGQSHDMLPRYWSPAPNAKPTIAAMRNAMHETITLRLDGDDDLARSCPSAT
jgi:hypothetical protein